MGTVVVWVAIGLTWVAIIVVLLGHRFAVLRNVGWLLALIVYPVLGVGAIAAGNMLAVALVLLLFITAMSFYLWASRYAKRRPRQTRNNE